VNNISPKRIKPHPEDDIRPELISPEDLGAYYAAAELERKRTRRREKWKRVFSISTVVCLVTVCGIQGSAIIYMLPLTKIVPLIVYQKDDGTVTHTANWSELPNHIKEDTIVNVVWQYVQYRESWSTGAAPLAYDVVSALSSPRVREQYQDMFEPKNPLNPHKVYGETTVQVHYKNWTPVCPENGCDGPPNRYHFWFDRVETPPGGQPGKRVPHSITVSILRDVPLPQDRIAWRWTYNAPQIQVIEYPGAQRESVAR
jgi:hypothetical protein